MKGDAERTAVINQQIEEERNTHDRNMLDIDEKYRQQIIKGIEEQKKAEEQAAKEAERLAKAVVGSSLVKAAMFGADANWGRVICAMGYSGAPFRPECVDISFSSVLGEVMVCKGGTGLDFGEELAKKILTRDEVVIDICLHEGESAATCWGCDLTYDYVKINGDYRS